MTRALDAAELTALLKPKPKPQTGKKKEYPVPPQEGPLKYFDQEQACLNSGYYAIDTETNTRFWKKTQGKCGSPTHWRLQGIPLCHVHVLYKMNRMLLELGVK